MASSDGSAKLITTKNEFIKTFSVYDGSFRLTDLYEAPTNGADGCPCLHTQYTYDGASTRILKTKESDDFWDATWDI